MRTFRFYFRFSSSMVWRWIMHERKTDSGPYNTYTQRQTTLQITQIAQTAQIAAAGCAAHRYGSAPAGC